MPDGAADIAANLYRRMPEARITDILLEVDDATRLTETFTHLRNRGALPRPHRPAQRAARRGRIILGLRKMVEGTTTHGFWELMRIARWHVEGDAFDRALAVDVDAQAALPMAAFSDRFSPFATQTIPATVHEAPYILDGLLMNETGRRVREQYADTGGFTDHVFAACSILGYAFVPRIRDLPSKRLYVVRTWLQAAPRRASGRAAGRAAVVLARVAPIAVPEPTDATTFETRHRTSLPRPSAVRAAPPAARRIPPAGSESPSADSDVEPAAQPPGRGHTPADTARPLTPLPVGVAAPWR